MINHRRTLRRMTDEELTAERRKVSNMAGKWAGNRYLAILNEQIEREERAEQVSS
jgi:hypothetical protein